MSRIWYPKQEVYYWFGKFFCRFIQLKGFQEIPRPVQIRIRVVIDDCTISFKICDTPVLIFANICV